MNPTVKQSSGCLSNKYTEPNSTFSNYLQKKFLNPTKQAYKAAQPMNLVKTHVQQRHQPEAHMHAVSSHAGQSWNRWIVSPGKHNRPAARSAKLSNQAEADTAIHRLSPPAVLPLTAGYF